MIDKNLSVERTPEVIALEINNITETMRKIFLLSAIDIGRKLAEAKIMVGHGEWGNWLKKSVNYSQRTASSFIAAFEEYGSSQMVIFCENAKSQAFANLSITQAMLLRGIPMEEREAFIEENDIHGMTTRELRQAIKEKQELEAKLREVEAGWAGAKKISEKNKLLAEATAEESKRLLKEKVQAESDKQVAEAAVEKLRDDLKKEKEKSKKEIDRLRVSIAENSKLLADAQASGDTDEVEHLNKLLVETDGELHTAHKKIEELERQIKEVPVEVTAAEIVEKVPEEVERELNELRERNKELEAKVSQPVETSTDRFKRHFDLLVNGFRDLLGVLDEIDADSRGKYKKVVVGLLSKMSERLVTEE
jgi:chromosome segregation ATPase